MTDTTERQALLTEIAKTLPAPETLGWEDGGMCEPNLPIKGYTKRQVLQILADHWDARAALAQAEQPARPQTPTRAEVDVLMKRCQIGVGGRDALDKAHSIMADCYGTLGALMLEIERLRTSQEAAPGAGEPVAIVRCWEEWLGGDKPRQLYELTQLDGFRALPTGEHKLYTAAPAADVARDAVEAPAARWLAVPAGGDTVRLLPVSKYSVGPDVFCKVNDVDAMLATQEKP